MRNYNPAKPLYLDYNATTPVVDSVLSAMIPWFGKEFGNAASNTHVYGWNAAEAVKIAREQTASLIGVQPDELIFTSGATEAINLAIKGVSEAYSSKGKHIVALSTEHKAVLDTLKYLEKQGFEITLLKVNESGQPDLDEISSVIRQDTILVIVMAANNESGVILPVKEIADRVHEKGSLFFCDATQACGKIPVNAQKDGMDMLSLSAHKFYGPKGSGALYIRRKQPRVTIIPQQHGGGHENGFRSGTLNVPGIVGMGVAAGLAANEMKKHSEKQSNLKHFFEKTITANCGAVINGNNSLRLPNTSNIRFSGIRADRFISLLPEIAFSTGSACTSALQEPSHVLLAMGLSEEEAYESIRISMGVFTKKEDVEFLLEKFENALIKLR